MATLDRPRPASVKPVPCVARPHAGLVHLDGVCA